MQTILCATDFSDAGQNALMYAGQVARLGKAKLVIVNSYEPLPLLIPGPVLVETIDDNTVFQLEQLEACAAVIDPVHILQIETQAVKGTAIHSILKEVDRIRPDLVVCGMKEMGKGIRRVLGSVATELAKKCTVPLLIVPEKFLYSGIGKIALAVERDLSADTDVHLLNLLNEIGSLFNSSLVLVKVSANSTQAAFELLNEPMRLRKLTKDLHPQFTSIAGNNIELTLNKFVEENAIEMMAVLSHHYSFLERMVIRSTTRSLVFSSEIPLLIIPFEQGGDERYN